MTLATLVAGNDDPDDDFVRTPYGAPKVADPDNPDKLRVYGRPSGFGGSLENPYNLIKWKERQIITGVILEGQLPDVVPDRDELDRICARAHTAAGSSVAADRGTHIHTLTERVDLGQPYADLIAEGERLGIAADLQRLIVDQYRRFRARLGIKPVAVELKVVNDRWQLAGTLDRLDHHDGTHPDITRLFPDGEAFIGDIKTGALTVDQKGAPRYWVKYGPQIVAYRDGRPYNVATGERYDWPAPPSDRYALIYHYPLERAIAGELVDWQAFPVDLAVAREMGDAAHQAKHAGKQRPLLQAITVTEPVDRERLRKRIGELIDAGHTELVQRRWPAGVPGLKETGHSDDQLAAILAAVQQVETETSATFHPDDAPPAPIRLPSKPVPPPPVIDEGEPVDAGTLHALDERWGLLDPARVANIVEIAGEAERAGRSISVTQRPTVRRWSIGRALVRWAETGGTLDDLWSAAVKVANGDQTTNDDQTLGGLLSTFTTMQANELHNLFDQTTNKQGATTT